MQGCLWNFIPVYNMSALASSCMDGISLPKWRGINLVNLYIYNTHWNLVAVEIHRNNENETKDVDKIRMGKMMVIMIIELITAGIKQ